MWLFLHLQVKSWVIWMIESSAAVYPSGLPAILARGLGEFSDGKSGVWIGAKRWHQWHQSCFSNRGVTWFETLRKSSDLEFLKDPSRQGARTSFKDYGSLRYHLQLLYCFIWIYSSNWRQAIFTANSKVFVLLTIPTHNIEVEDWDQSSPEAFRILGQPVVLASAQSWGGGEVPVTRYPWSFDLFLCRGCTNDTRPRWSKWSRPGK